MTGLVDNGIDIICFSVMVLLFGLSEKVSTPTSVILMVVNALTGFILHLAVLGGKLPAGCGSGLGSRSSVRGILSNDKTIAGDLIMPIALELISSLCLMLLTGNVVSVSLAVFVVII